MFRYTIIVDGYLDDRWRSWFPEMEITLGAEGTTQIVGNIPDQSALHGMLSRIRDLQLCLLLVRLENGIGEEEKE